MRHLKKVGIIAATVLGLLLLTAGGCDGKEDETTKSESSIRDKSYRSLVAAEPAHRMTNPSTRKTINFWIDTWNKKGQLAFVYMLSADGAQVGYYVLDGPPVSMCAALTPTWRYEGTPQDDSDDLDQRVPAPSVDGVYYSGGQCSSYYGKDASTGAYVEFSIGNGLNYFLSTQPLPVESKPLAFTSVDKTVREADGTYKVK